MNINVGTETIFCAKTCLQGKKGASTTINRSNSLNLHKILTLCRGALYRAQALSL